MAKLASPTWTKSSASNSNVSTIKLNDADAIANATALPNAGTAYSDGLEVGVDLALGNCTFAITTEDSAGGAIDFNLVGCDTVDGTYVKLKDDIVAAWANTNAAATKVAVINLADYPAAFYAVEVISGADESSNKAMIHLYQDSSIQQSLSIGGVGADPS
tara:strand:+ start:130 stop:609 length:480 start_codon:yes stop_codon:yes gene_type:complete